MFVCLFVLYWYRDLWQTLHINRQKYVFSVRKQIISIFGRSQCFLTVKGKGITLSFLIRESSQDKMLPSLNNLITRERIGRLVREQLLKLFFLWMWSIKSNYKYYGIKSMRCSLYIILWIKMITSDKLLWNKNNKTFWNVQLLKNNQLQIINTTPSRYWLLSYNSPPHQVLFLA